MAETDDRVAHVMQQIATAVHENLFTISESLTASIRADIPSLDAEADLHRTLGASVEGNIANLQILLALAVDDDQISTPTSASHFARRLAQRGIPVGDLLRAYRIGQGQFMRWAYRELLGTDGLDPSTVLDAGLALNDLAYRYVDRVSEQVLADYTAERDALTRSNGARRQRAIRDVLDGVPVPIDQLERTLGHRIAQRHVGAVFWLPDPDHVADPALTLDRSVEAAGRIGSGPRPVLAVPRDDDSVMVWVPVGDDETLTTQAWHDVLGPDTNATIGDPGVGLAGFRSTMHGALRAHATVTHLTHPPESVVPFRAVAPIAALVQDVDAARSWVRETLGNLADDDDQARGFRESLAVFLGVSSSFQAASKVLNVHKNTVAYRVRRAEELRGRPIADDRLEVEIALLAARWLGSAVLGPPEDTRHHA